MAMASKDPEVLKFFEEHGYATTMTVARALEMNKGNTSTRIKRLVAAGKLAYDEDARVYYLAKNPETGERYRLGLVAI